MNTVPEIVQERIEELLFGISGEKLTVASEKLSTLYRENLSSTPPIVSLEEHLAYLVVRMPATFASLYAVFEALQKKLPHFQPKTLLDIGAGPGTGYLVATQVFQDLMASVLIERDPTFIELGKKLIDDPRVEWQRKELKVIEKIDTFDLIICSYVCNELERSTLMATLQHAYDMLSEKGLLVIVEAGTPRGYRTIIEARDALLAKGVQIIAPCPHVRPCPMTVENWCHFSTRLPRTRLHRAIKKASLGYEDEKFSYVILSKSAHHLVHPGDRIVRSPQRHSGFVEFTLCTEEGTLEKKKIAKRDGALFKLAKKADWGDILSRGTSVCE